MKTVQMIFCILACVFVLACLPFGIFLGWEWAVVSAALAIVCAFVMFRTKDARTPKNTKPDFMDSDDKEEK